METNNCEMMIYNVFPEPSITFESPVANNLDILEDYKSFHQQETVPIILANDKTTGHTFKVGGYSDLLEHQIGK